MNTRHIEKSPVFWRLHIDTRRLIAPHAPNKKPPLYPPGVYLCIPENHNSRFIITGRKGLKSGASFNLHGDIGNNHTGHQHHNENGDSNDYIFAMGGKKTKSINNFTFNFCPKSITEEDTAEAIFSLAEGTRVGSSIVRLKCLRLAPVLGGSCPPDGGGDDEGGIFTEM